MTVAKSKIVRPFAPDYCSRETLAYRLDYGVSSIDDFVRRGLLPKPVDVGTGPRWRWSDVDTFIRARNGESQHTNSAPGFVSAPGEDPYDEGIRRARNAEAAHG